MITYTRIQEKVKFKTEVLSSKRICIIFMSLNLVVVGATGAVGQEILKLLETRHVSIKHLRCFASERSLGKEIFFQIQKNFLRKLSLNSFVNCDIVFFTAGGKISKEWAPIAIREGAIVIDWKSDFRMDPTVPLIMPEINAHALREHHRLIASPNCSTTIMLMALAPLHRRVPIKRVVVATYQASGAGKQAMQELQEETRCLFKATLFLREVLCLFPMLLIYSRITLQ